MDIKHGFVIKKIKCSGCSFDGLITKIQFPDELYPDLDIFAGSKDELVSVVFRVHNGQRGKCSGGRLRIEYSPAVSMAIDGKG